jgi:hypothetical protein
MFTSISVQLELAPFVDGDLVFALERLGHHARRGDAAARARPAAHARGGSRTAGWLRGQAVPAITAGTDGA